MSSFWSCSSGEWLRDISELITRDMRDRSDQFSFDLITQEYSTSNAGDFLAGPGPWEGQRRCHHCLPSILTGDGDGKPHS